MMMMMMYFAFFVSDWLWQISSSIFLFSFFLQCFQSITCFASRFPVSYLNSTAVCLTLANAKARCRMSLGYFSFSHSFAFLLLLLLLRLFIFIDFRNVSRLANMFVYRQKLLFSHIRAIEEEKCVCAYVCTVWKRAWWVTIIEFVNERENVLLLTGFE